MIRFYMPHISNITISSSPALIIWPHVTLTFNSSLLIKTNCKGVQCPLAAHYLSQGCEWLPLPQPADTAPQQTWSQSAWCRWSGSQLWGNVSALQGLLHVTKKQKQKNLILGTWRRLEKDTKQWKDMQLRRKRASLPCHLKKEWKSLLAVMKLQFTQLLHSSGRSWLTGSLWSYTLHLGSSLKRACISTTHLLEKKIKDLNM